MLETADGSKKTRILFIYGTRPEAIKMVPLIKEFRKQPDLFDVKICLTGQHREMLDQVNSFFGIQSDYDLNIMQKNQTLFDVTSLCIKGLEDVLAESRPDIVFVQGDTTSVLAGSIASYYFKIPVAHLEAGLRSSNKYSPFPEEINRKIAGQIAEYHFAPTIGAAENLAREGIIDHVYVVGNTVIDALFLGLELIHEKGDQEFLEFFHGIDFSKRIVLVTGHRRESFGEGFENICRAILKMAQNHNEIEVVYPVHLNPNVREPVKKYLGGMDNIHILDPLDYPRFIWLIEKCSFVLTDSGGLQEEAPSLGKPVLVMRDVTERMEGISAGTARLVGTDYARIVSNAEELLSTEERYQSMAKAVNPYGDGKASRKIVDIVSSLHFKGRIH
jgi:UDP-N-acetylglucosamine 2-epimerase (non-hydrolysing)